MGITEVITAPRSPWQNAYVERLVSSIRRECLDHVIVFNERYLRRVLSSYFQYHHDARTHLSLDKDCPRPRPIQRSAGNIIAFPRLEVCIIAMNVERPEIAEAARSSLSSPNRPELFLSKDNNRNLHIQCQRTTWAYVPVDAPRSGRRPPPPLTTDQSPAAFFVPHQNAQDDPRVIHAEVAVTISRLAVTHGGDRSRRGYEQANATCPAASARSRWRRR